MSNLVKFNYECEGQISIFDIIDPEKSEGLPCDSCGYCVQGCCDYPCTKDDYCILGDKKIPKVKPGDLIGAENVGEQLTFDEITRMIDQLVVMDYSTVSRARYKVVKVEKIVMVENNTIRRLVYYDGTRERGLLNETFFNELAYIRARAYRLKG